MLTPQQAQNIITLLGPQRIQEAAALVESVQALQAIANQSDEESTQDRTE